MHTKFSSLFALLSVLSSVHSYHWPSPQYDQLEALVYERTTEEGGRSLIGPLNGCRPINDTTNENAAGNWLRMAFHDMATHDIDTGLGGMDASVYFEFGYRGNFGKGMPDAQANLAPFTTKYISKADVLALSVVMITAECNGPLMPFKGGRIDVFEAAPDTAPIPFDTIEVHIEKFRHEGLNVSEMIAIVACGHTVGGVRNPDFPTIVPPAPIDPYVYLFDPTTAFDNLVVTQYLDGTTKNPLVVNDNVTVSSDLRVFSSDGNVTMKALADPKVFEETCGNVFTKMINTVASNVTLTDNIELLPFKVAGVQLSVNDTGLMNLKASLRLLTANPKRKVTMLWSSKDGSCAEKANKCSAPFTSTVDTTTGMTRRRGFSPQKYFFNALISATASVSKFWFEVDEGNGQRPFSVNNDGTGYEITQDFILYEPAKSTINGDGSFDIVVAARTNPAPSRVYATVYQTIAQFASTTTVDFALDSSITPISGYSFYKANIPGPHFTFDLFSVVGNSTYYEDARDTFFIPA